MPNGGSTFWSFFPCRTDELDAVNKLNERNSAWWDNFVSETAGNSYWRGLAIKFLHEAKIALYKLVEELTVTSDTCGRANWIWKFYGYVWTGRQCPVRRRWTPRIDGLALYLLTSVTRDIPDNNTHNSKFRNDINAFRNRCILTN